MRCRAIVDLGALVHNFTELAGRAGGRAALLCVVKANAYGHGAAAVARALAAAGGRNFAVATLSEAVALRDAAPGSAIVVLGGLEQGEEPEASRWGIVPLLGSIAQLQCWRNEARRVGRRLPCHLLLNTGMNRMGIDLDPSGGRGTRSLLDALGSRDGLELRGVATHYASAEDLGSGQAQRQAEIFGRQLAVLRSEGITPRLVHADNTAALVHRGVTVPRDCGSAAMARPGLGLYGYVKPAVGCEAQTTHGLRPVLEWRARLRAVRQVAAGESLGYGATFTATRPMRVGVLSVGYADGLDWQLSNRGSVLVQGSSCPIVGEVSMDLTTIDLAAAPRARAGAEAVLLGAGRHDAHGMAALTGGTPYELLCRISPRVTREYVSGPETR